MTWKPDWEKKIHVVLETRDNEDSASIFSFSVSSHKKELHFKKKSPKSAQFILYRWSVQSVAARSRKSQQRL